MAEMSVTEIGNAVAWIMRHDCDDYQCHEHYECAVCKCGPECMDVFVDAEEGTDWRHNDHY